MMVVQSGIARGNRLVEISEAHELGEIAFVGYEGVGALQTGSGHI